MKNSFSIVDELFQEYPDCREQTNHRIREIRRFLAGSNLCVEERAILEAQLFELLRILDGLTARKN